MSKYKILGALAGMALASRAQAATVFAVDENNNLVMFNSATPGIFTSSKKITGTTATFLALDVRDSNNRLYGLGDDLRLYTINTVSAVATAVGGPLAITGTNFGFDFNTAIDALRVVSNNGNNYVINPNTGMVTTTATPVAFAAGDVNAGMMPIVTGNGYLHGTATQYALDTNTDFLVRQANNAGTLTSVGSLGVAVGPRASFDIDFDGIGYIQDSGRFYTVNLQTGQASFVGRSQRALFGVAIAGVPEPGTWAMMILGFGLVGGTMRRRSASIQRAQVRFS